MELTMRTYINSGTIIEVAGNIRYKINGTPIGEGGCSIIYAAKKYIPAANGEYTESPLDFAIKECFPIGEGLNIYRDENGSIVAGDDASEKQFALIKAMQKNEADVSGRVFNVGFRITPVLETYDNVSIVSENEEIKATNNLVSILGSLSEKGQSLKTLLASTETKKLTAEQAFRIGEQLLYAVEEVHKAGYLHLDIQDGNVFLHGSLEDRNNMISLLDFGTAKELSKGNTCEVNPKDLYSTQGFTAPEILLCEEETLRLGCQADIYSVGALMLHLLTGQKTSSRTLIDNKSETFIPKFAIQSTKCPKHLVDRMQGIIAKALNVDAAKRYSSASEMLVDVADFLEAIAPYRNPLKSSKYDAFICYKHNKLDNMAAKTLRDSLERFKAKSLDKNDKQKIESVFMDEGELSSCADFGERINDALKNSEWLIVICSNETKESRWVNEEIRTFLKYHNKSHILAVITEGEPDDVYPLELKKNGLDASTLFAADARADGDFNKTKRIIQADVRLRIAASILDVTYDSLKQRRKLYELKMVVIVSLIAFFLLSVITIRTIQLNREHKESLKKQAVYLEEQAEDAYDEDNPIESIKAAISAYELSEEAGSFSSKSLLVMSRNLDLYSTGGGLVKPVDVFKVEEEKDTRGEFILLENGKYLATANDDTVFVWDVKTHKQVSKFKSDQFNDEMFVSGHRCVRDVLGGVELIDYLTGEVIWKKKIDGVITASLSDDEEYMIVYSLEGWSLYDLKNNTITPIREENSVACSVCKFDSNNKIILVTSSGGWGNSVFGTTMEKCTLDITCFNPKTLEIEWENKDIYIDTSSNIDTVSSKNYVYVSYGNHIKKIDRKTGKTNQDYETRSPIEVITVYSGVVKDGVAQAYLEDGGCCIETEIDGEYSFACLNYFPNELCYCDRADNTFFVRCLEANLTKTKPEIIEYVISDKKDSNFRLTSKKTLPSDLIFSKDRDYSSWDENASSFMRELELDEKPMTWKWLDKNKLVIVFENHISIYDKKTKKFNNSINLEKEHSIRFYNDNVIERIDEETILVLDEYYGVFFHLGKDGPQVMDFFNSSDFAYSPSCDSFYYLDDTSNEYKWEYWNEPDEYGRYKTGDSYEGKIYSIKRYKAETIVDMAQKMVEN